MSDYGFIDDNDETTGGDGYGTPIARCNVCGRELMRRDEKAVGACAVCMNEEVEDDEG